MSKDQMPMKKREKAGYYALKSIAHLISLIPRPVGLAIFRQLGYLVYLLDKKDRQITFNNLSYAFGEDLTKKELQQLNKKVFIHFGQFMFDFIWSRHIKVADYHRWFEVEGREHLEAARRKDKGFLFLTAHMGVWELLTFFFAGEGLACNSVYTPPKFVMLDQFLADSRLRFGANKFPVHEALEHILAAMGRKEPVPLLMDITVRPQRGVVAWFFGRRVIANKGMVMLALQTEAPVVPLFLVRDGQRYKIILKPEIPLVKTGDPRKDIEINTQSYNTAIEEIAREYPEQYNWIYKKWKHRPYSPWPSK